MVSSSRQQADIKLSEIADAVTKTSTTFLHYPTAKRIAFQSQKLYFPWEDPKWRTCLTQGSTVSKDNHSARNLWCRISGMLSMQHIAGTPVTCTPSSLPKNIERLSKGGKDLNCCGAGFTSCLDMVLDCLLWLSLSEWAWAVACCAVSHHACRLASHSTYSHLCRGWEQLTSICKQERGCARVALLASRWNIIYSLLLVFDALFSARYLAARPSHLRGSCCQEHSLLVCTASFPIELCLSRARPGLSLG